MPDLDPITIQARSVLLDALEALHPYRDEVIVVGAQVIYLRTGSAIVAVAEATKDSDFVIDPRHLPHEPLIEEAMEAADFKLNLDNRNPGAWVSPAGIPVDLMVPGELSGVSARHRGARIPPHSPKATRRTVGLEACVVDCDEMLIPALAEDDSRQCTARVAGVAALIIAKVHKIHERIDEPHRLNDKDAHDIHRPLAASDDLHDVGENFRRLSDEPVCAEITRQAIEWLPSMFADGPDAIGSMMASAAVDAATKSGSPSPVTFRPAHQEACSRKHLHRFLLSSLEARTVSSGIAQRLGSAHEQELETLALVCLLACIGVV